MIYTNNKPNICIEFYKFLNLLQEAFEYIKKSQDEDRRNIQESLYFFDWLQDHGIPILERLTSNVILYTDNAKFLDKMDYNNFILSRSLEMKNLHVLYAVLVDSMEDVSDALMYIYKNS